MTNSLNLKLALQILAIFIILIWLAICKFSGTSTFSWAAINAIFTSVGFVTPMAILFAKWGWRWRIFRGWLVLIPNLNGTWEGEFRSEWIDPKTQEKIPRKAYLVIKQALFSAHCYLLTNESKSDSFGINIEQTKSGKFIVSYVYSNSPRASVQHRSKAHDGASKLDLIEKPNKKLAGKYFTERDTKGELAFKLVSKKLRQEF